MAKKDPRIDAYISKSAEFAKPVLKHLRRLVHQACPDVQETMKWSFPHFEYQGVLCFMSAFKQHCAFGFWKSSVLSESAAKVNTSNTQAMGQFGRITSIDDLPSERQMLSLIKKAVKVNESKVRPSPRAAKAAPEPVKVPDYFMAALRRDKKAMAVFTNFSPSHKREYVEWVTKSKSDETRERRLVQAIEWMAEGKPRNWKYTRRKSS